MARVRLCKVGCEIVKVPSDKLFIRSVKQKAYVISVKNAIFPFLGKSKGKIAWKKISRTLFVVRKRVEKTFSIC